MHAATWNGKSLDGCSWLATMAGRHEEFFVVQKQCTAEFIQRLGNRLDPEIVELIERTNTGYDNLVTLLTEQPSALVHLDYRADNLMIDETCEPPTVTAVDWQTLRLGPPSIDIAYFIGASLKAEVRRAYEMALLERYYDLLIKHGVSDFSWEQCQRDYQAGCYWGVMMAVVSATVVEETERGNAMFTTMARRHGSQILDLGADKLLSYFGTGAGVASSSRHRQQLPRQ